MSSLFGTQSVTQNQSSTGTGLFGSATNNQSSLGGAAPFGSNALTGNQNKLGGGLGAGGSGLFGTSTNTTTTQPSTAGGLFGSSLGASNAQNNLSQNTGLFGASTNTTNPSSGGLFGSTTNTAQPTSSGGLFGQSNNASTNMNQSTTTSGLFGSANNQNANAGSSLLSGAQNNANQNNNSLFSSSINTNSANRPSLFAGGPSSAQPQNQQQTQQQLGGPLYGPSTVSVGAQGHVVPAASLQRLQMSGFSTVPNEKKVADQIRTLSEKWNPDSGSTILKSYLYNAVEKQYAPFFYPNTQIGEDDKSWEEALSQRPSVPKIEGTETAALAFVPVMCRGFKALGERVEVQAKSVLEMRNRLHEMNNSLSAVMDRHQQHITVKIENAKRQHQVLSQRCLRLAVKVQVLRNRGFALDHAEESLRLTLRKLDQRVQDPVLAGREDEIWARMVALRERTRWLEEEGKRVAAQVDEQNRQAGSGASSGIPEHVLSKTRRILKDYNGQLMHLDRELEDVKREFATWQGTQQ